MESAPVLGYKPWQSPQQAAALQARSDAEFYGKLNEIGQNIGNLQTKLSNFAPGSADYQQTMNDLRQAIQSRNDLFHPAKNPGALQKFGHLLHLTKGPQTPSATFQPGAIQAPAYTAEPITLGGEPGYRQTTVSLAQKAAGEAASPQQEFVAFQKAHPEYRGTFEQWKAMARTMGTQPARISSTSAERPGLPEETLSTAEPGLPAQGIEIPAGPKLPGGPAVKVQGPALTPERLAAIQKAQSEAEQMAAAAPLTPEQQAVQQAQVENAGGLAAIQGKIKNFRILYPDATPEEERAYLSELLQTTTGAKAGAEKFMSQLTTTKDAAGKDHYWRVPLAPGGKPEEVDFNGQTIVPKASTAKPVRAWKKDASGRITSVLLDPQTNMPLPGTENPDILPPPYLTERISTGNYHWVDQNNQIHQTPESRTTRPVLPSGAPAAAGAGAPQTGAGQSIGELRKKARVRFASPAATGGTQTRVVSPPSAGGAAAPAAGKSGDQILGVKGSAPLNKARNDYVEAVKIASIADQVATKPNDAINQKRLAVALERASAGRFTVQALDYIIKAGWGNTLQQWANSPTTGALPSDVLRQLVDGAHENLKAAQDAVKALTSTPEQGSGGKDDPLGVL